MSPEQAQGRATDARSDIFSFGLVLYELLAGRPAFSGNSAIEVIVAIVRDEPAPLNLPARLSDTLMRCLRKAPAARFQTMSEVRAALKQFDAAVNMVQAEPPPSIAVLPFANMSRDTDDEYFSDGLAEEILNLLTKISGLRVRLPALPHLLSRAGNMDIRLIAEALGVRTILEGSVRRAGNRVRVTAQLIEAENGSHLWSERYDREMTDVFVVQDEIGEAISQALKVKLAPRTSVVNLDAWQHFLKGEYHRGRNTPESAASGIEHFERALAIDPNYVQAHSGLALCYYVLGLMGLRPVGDVTRLVTSEAGKALAIAPSHCESHIALAIAAGVFDHDWPRAETHHLKSLAANPVHPRAHYCYGYNYLIPHGRKHEAVEQSRLALESDPLNLLYHSGLLWALYCAGEYQEGMDCALRAMEINPNFHLTVLHFGFIQLAAGLPDEAAVSFRRVIELAPWLIGPGCLAAALHSAGDYSRSREMASQFPRPDGLNFGHAVYYAVAGEADAMFEALQCAYQRRNIYMPCIKHVPPFTPYHSDPRFQTLLKRMNLS